MFHRIFRLSSSVGQTTVSRSLAAKHHRRDMHCRKIVYEEYGDPMKVVSLVEQTLPDKLDDEQVPIVLPTDSLYTNNLIIYYLLVYS